MDGSYPQPSLGLGVSSGPWANFKDKCDQVVFECMQKVAEIIVQSRVLQQVRSREKKGRVRFNLDTEELEFVRRSMDDWRGDLHMPLGIDIFWEGCAHAHGPQMDKTRVLLERWSIVYVDDRDMYRHGERDHDHGRDVLAQLRTQVYKRMIILLRTIYSFVRMAPAYQVYCRIQSARTGFGPHPNTDEDMGFSLYPQDHSAGSGLDFPATGGGTGSYSVHPIQTPFGTLHISTVYKRAADIKVLDGRRLSGLDVSSSMTTSIIQDYVPGATGEGVGEDGLPDYAMHPSLAPQGGQGARGQHPPYPTYQYRTGHARDEGDAQGQQGLAQGGRGYTHRHPQGGSPQQGQGQGQGYAQESWTPDQVPSRGSGSHAEARVGRATEAGNEAGGGHSLRAGETGMSGLGVALQQHHHRHQAQAQAHAYKHAQAPRAGGNPAAEHAAAFVQGQDRGEDSHVQQQLQDFQHDQQLRRHQGRPPATPQQHAQVYAQDNGARGQQSGQGPAPFLTPGPHHHKLLQRREGEGEGDMGGHSMSMGPLYLGPSAHQEPEQQTQHGHVYGTPIKYSNVPAEGYGQHQPGTLHEAQATGDTATGIRIGHPTAFGGDPLGEHEAAHGRRRPGEAHSLDADYRTRTLQGYQRGYSHQNQPWQEGAGQGQQCLEHYDCHPADHHGGRQAPQEHYRHSTHPGPRGTTTAGSRFQESSPGTSAGNADARVPQGASPQQVLHRRNTIAEAVATLHTPPAQDGTVQGHGHGYNKHGRQDGSGSSEEGTAVTAVMVPRRSSSSLSSGDGYAHASSATPVVSATPPSQGTPPFSLTRLEGAPPSSVGGDHAAPLTLDHPLYSFSPPFSVAPIAHLAASPSISTHATSGEHKYSQGVGGGHSSVLALAGANPSQPQSLLETLPESPFQGPNTARSLHARLPLLGGAGRLPAGGATGAMLSTEVALRGTSSTATGLGSLLTGGSGGGVSGGAQMEDDSYASGAEPLPFALFSDTDLDLPAGKSVDKQGTLSQAADLAAGAGGGSSPRGGRPSGLSSAMAGMSLGGGAPPVKLFALCSTTVDRSAALHGHDTPSGTRHSTMRLPEGRQDASQDLSDPASQRLGVMETPAVRAPGGVPTGWVAPESAGALSVAVNPSQYGPGNSAAATAETAPPRSLEEELDEFRHFHNHLQALTNTGTPGAVSASTATASLTGLQ